MKSISTWLPIGLVALVPVSKGDWPANVVEPSAKRNLNVLTPVAVGSSKWKFSKAPPNSTASNCAAWSASAAVSKLARH